MPRERARDLLRRVLRATDEDCEIEGARAVEALRLGELVGDLIGLLPAPRPDVSIAVAHALGAIGDPVAEEALLQLSEAVRVDVQKAAIEALGGCGSPRAIGRLRALGGALFAGEVGDLAEKAISRIRGRNAGAEEGTLAIADQGGELSVPPEKGAVSLAREKN